MGKFNQVFVARKKHTEKTELLKVFVYVFTYLLSYLKYLNN